MKRLLKKLLSAFLSLAVVIACVPMMSFKVEATSRTVDEAVSWVIARANEAWNVDVDGAYGCQCVDLIYAYYEFLGYSRMGGNASDYAYGSFGIPYGSGWYKDSSPSIGAIVVWPSWANGYGHIGIVYSINGSTIYTVETNIDNGGSDYGGPARYCERSSQNAVYIHPDFSGTTPPSPIEYSSITPGTYYLISKSDGKALTLANNEDWNTNNVHVWDARWSNRGQQMVITEAPDGYKIRPIDSTRLINPYGDYAQSGQTVNIYDDVNDSSQWWKFQKVDGGYIIRNAQDTNLALDNVQSDNAAVYTCHGEANQVWELIPAAAPEKPVISNMKSSYEVGETVSVLWNSTAYTNQYNIAVEKKENGEYKGVLWKENVSAGFNLSKAVNLEAGDYRVRVASVNNKLLLDYSADSYYLSTVGDYVNFTVKAKTAATYTVKFNANGGNGTMSDVVMTVDKSQNLPANAFTRNGYTFLGWSTNKSAASATYTDKQSVKNLAKSGTVTLYAIWKKNTEVSKLNLNLFNNGISQNSTYYGGKFNLGAFYVGNSASDKELITSITYKITFDPKVIKYLGFSSEFDNYQVNIDNVADGSVTIASTNVNEPFYDELFGVFQFEVIGKNSCNTTISATIISAYNEKDQRVTEKIIGNSAQIAVNSGKLGDLTGDGYVDILDAKWMLQAAAGSRTLTEQQRSVADVNKDGYADILDAKWLLQAAAGSRTL